jgi:hypothetical protein
MGNPSTMMVALMVSGPEVGAMQVTVISLVEPFTAVKEMLAGAEVFQVTFVRGEVSKSTHPDEVSCAPKAQNGE